MKYAKGRKTKQQILSQAANLSSSEGLYGLTIGRLAAVTKLSKSGLFSHFGSKEELQLETVRHARGVFIESIITPAADIAGGLSKLVCLIKNWVNYVEGSVFEGGCFFYAVSAEMDDRPGRVRDLVAHLTMSWVRVLENEVRTAIQNGELKSDTDVKLLVFRIHGYVQESNWFYRLHEREDSFEMAREAIASVFVEAGAAQESLEVLSNE